MKKTFLITLGILVAISLLSSQDLNNLNTRLITVTGSAEINVQPDEIELEIILKEYGDRPNKTDLNSIESEVLYILKKNKVPHDKIIYDNENFRWYYWWGYRYEYYKQKVFTLKLDKTTDFLALMKALDIDGVHSLRISRTTNHQLQDLRKEVKTQAIQAAKEKAKYLLESIGEKLGSVISIEESPEYAHYNYGHSELLSNVASNANRTGEEIENMATIKLRYEIKAKFEIAD